VRAARVTREQTQVAIIGGGPAGLLLSHILQLSGIDSIVIERQSRAHVLGRIRAGVLEAGSVALLRDVGLGTRLMREGHEHRRVGMAWLGRDLLYIDIQKHTGRSMVTYGQTQLTEDLYAARDAAGGRIIDEAGNVRLHDVAAVAPYVTFEKGEESFRIDCEYIAGCDGSHGICRASIPPAQSRSFERAYPFGWLGIMAETPPYPELVYCYHKRGFALASRRSPMLSRYYVQCEANAKLEDWPDERFWSEFKMRCPPEMAKDIVTGPSIEKSIAPLRSFVSEPMQYGRLFLAGDAAHIVPPTGAKGLNLAISDVYYLARSLIDAAKKNNPAHLETYSAVALRRVWAAVRFSWWMTNLLHRFPTDTPFDEYIRKNEFEYLTSSEHAQAALAEQYVGLPYA
jgi:p-hydroxybenzoate 3-monooxygenase